MTFDGFTPVSSDHLDAVKFDSFEKKLTIRFKNGAHYSVHGVLPEDYQAFMDAPSQGSHFHSVIKQNFHIERVK
jgi:hypothetical protein